MHCSYIYEKSLIKIIIFHLNKFTKDPMAPTILQSVTIRLQRLYQHFGLIVDVEPAGTLHEGQLDSTA